LQYSLSDLRVRVFYERAQKFRCFEVKDITALGPAAGRLLVDSIVANPERFLGNPRPRVSSGRSLDIDGLPSEALSAGLGMQRAVFQGDIGTILDNIRAADSPVTELQLSDLGTISVRESLEATLDIQRVDLVSGALRSQLTFNAATGPTFPAVGLATGRLAPDRLDAILAAARDDDIDDGLDDGLDEETPR